MGVRNYFFFDTNLNFISLKNAKAIRFMIILSVHAIRLALTHTHTLAMFSIRAPELKMIFKRKGEPQDTKQEPTIGLVYVRVKNSIPN